MISSCIVDFHEVLNKGFDAQHFVSGLSKHLRYLLVSKDPQTIKLMEVGADIGKKYQQQAKQCSADFLFNALKINNDCDLNYRISSNKRLLVELTLIRICQLTNEKKNSVTLDQVPEVQPIHVEKKQAVQPITNKT